MHEEAYDWAWDQPLRGSAKLVLLALVDQSEPVSDAGAGYECTVTKRTLVDATGLENRTVTAALDALVEAGLIVISAAGGWRRKVTLAVRS